MLKFTNPETAAAFECLVEVDHVVGKPQVYKSGPLSKIPPAMAEAMIAQNSNLLKRKDTKAEAEKKPETAPAAKTDDKSKAATAETK